MPEVVLRQVPYTRVTYLGVVLRELGTVRTVVEVGVLRGRYSAQLLSNLKPDKLVLIDPWSPQDTTEAYKRHDKDAWDGRYEYVANRFADAVEVEIIRAWSPAAAGRFEDGSLDMVYIDACHQYEAARDDMLAWKGKVKPGGYLAGHDYIPPTPLVPEDWTGVWKACHEVMGRPPDAVTTEKRFPKSFFYRM